MRGGCSPAGGAERSSRPQAWRSLRPRRVLTAMRSTEQDVRYTNLGNERTLGMHPERLWWISSRLYYSGHRVLAKLVKTLNYLLFSAVLPCECRITRTILMLHRGLGVVVHPNTTIGNNVHIGHCVTLAAGSNKPDTLPPIQPC